MCGIRIGARIVSKQRGECGRGRGRESKGAGASKDTEQMHGSKGSWYSGVGQRCIIELLHEWWRLTMNRFVSSFSVRILSVLISFKIRFLSTFENPPMRTVFHATM